MWSFYPSILNVNHAECIMCWENVTTSKFHPFHGTMVHDLKTELLSREFQKTLQIWL